MVTSNLNVHVKWEAVAKLLDLPAGSPNLPTLSQCPLCGGRLKLFNDTKNLGVYHYCYSCHSEGDLIRLLEQAWDVTTETVLEMLTLGGFLQGVAAEQNTKHRYIRYCRDTFAQGKQIWDTARHELERHDNWHVEQLLSQLQLRAGSRALDAWKNGPGRLLGSSHARQINLILYPSCIETNGRFRGCQRIFRGAKWGPLLVIPLYTYPKRVQALLFIGREGRIMQDVVLKPMYRHTALRPHNRSDPVDVGMLGGNLIPDCQSDQIVISDQWLFVLQAQIEHFRTSRVPLPLAAWWDYNRVRTANLDALDGRQAVIWAREIHSGVLERALMSDLPISMVQPSGPMQGRSGRDWQRRFRGRRLTEHMWKHAKPWPIQVGQWYRQHPAQLREDLEEWPQYGIDVELVLNEAKLRRVSGVERCRQFRGRQNAVVQERLGFGWEYRSNQQHFRQISNGIVRITRTLYDPELDVIFYQGTLRILGKRAHFIVDATTARKGQEFFKTLEQLAASHQLGTYRFLKQFRHRLLEFALGLHTPEQVQGKIGDFVKKLQQSGVAYGIY